MKRDALGPALAVGLLSFVAIPCLGANGALFVSQKVPSEMVSGSTYYVEITFQNTGDTTWTKAGLHRLGAINPYDNLTWLGSTNRMELKDSESIAPGQNATFGFNVFGPATPGAVDFQWRMLQEAVEWFGDTTVNVAVTVKPRLETGHSAYQAGESPSYSVSGAPAGTAILWSAWKNGVQTQNNVDLGDATDAGGGWTGTGPAWAAGDAGFWTKQASVGGHTGRVNFSVEASLTAAVPSVATRTLSAFHGAGDYRLTSEPFLDEGAKLVAGLNPNLIFVYLTSGYQTLYPATDFGAGPITSLKTLAQTAPYQRLFAMSFSTFVITAHSFTNEPWINTHPRGALGAGRYAAEKTEFYDLAKYLLETYQGTGRTFILKNWEGDWLMNETFQPYYQPDATQRQAFTDWIDARHEGVVQARTELAALTGVRVLTAAEFTVVDHARYERPCWLSDVLSSADSDLMSYSSWQTITSTPTANLRRKILEDLSFIRRHPSAQGRDVLIAEYGFPENEVADSGSRTDIAARAFLDAGLPAAFYWEILDNECQFDQGAPGAPGTCRGLGLFRPDGSKAPAWYALAALLGSPISSSLGSAAGGTISQTSPAGTALVQIPGGAFSEDVSVTLQQPASFPPSSSEGGTLQGLGTGLEVVLSKALQPVKPVILTLPYRDSDAAGKDESRFVAARFDEGSRTWVPLLTTPDPAANTVTAATRHLSVFQIMVSNPADDLSRVRVVPNPFRPARGHTGMGFFNLPAHARLRVYTQTGELIKDMSANAAGQASWDGTNMNGKAAASGVYHVLVQGAGKSRTVAVAVQR